MSEYMHPSFFTISFVFLISFIVSLYVLPKLARFAVKIGLIDHPNWRKVHVIPKTLVGGLGMTIGLLISSLIFLPINDLRGFYTGALLLVLVGFLDDFRQVNPNIKFIVQVVAALLPVYFNNRVLLSFGDVFGFGDFTTGILAIPLTVFCTVGVINALNMIDGLDGLAGGVSFISLLSLAVLSSLGGRMELLLLCVALSGAVLAFLRFNWQPAKLFMGDAGSQLLGFSLAFLSISLTQGDAGTIPPVAPLLILAVPVTDTVTIMLKRILQGKNPFYPDRYHFHHILLRFGIDKNNSVKVILVISSLFSLIAIAGTVMKVPEHYLFMIYCGFFLLFFSLSFHLKMLVRLKGRHMAKQPEGERRVLERKHVEWEVEISLHDPLMIIPDWGSRIPGRIADVSRDGIGLILESPIETSQRIILYTKGNGGALHSMKVQWCRKMNEYYRVGLVFLESGQEFEILEKYSHYYQD